MDGSGGRGGDRGRNTNRIFTEDENNMGIKSRLRNARGARKIGLNLRLSTRLRSVGANMSTGGPASRKKNMSWYNTRARDMNTLDRTRGSRTRPLRRTAKIGVRYTELSSEDSDDEEGACSDVNVTSGPTPSDESKEQEPAGRVVSVTKALKIRRDQAIMQRKDIWLRLRSFIDRSIEKKFVEEPALRATLNSTKKLTQNSAEGLIERPEKYPETTVEKPRKKSAGKPPGKCSKKSTDEPTENQTNKSAEKLTGEVAERRPEPFPNPERPPGAPSPPSRPPSPLPPSPPPSPPPERGLLEALILAEKAPQSSDCVLQANSGDLHFNSHQQRRTPQRAASTAAHADGGYLLNSSGIGGGFVGTTARSTCISFGKQKREEDSHPDANHHSCPSTEVPKTPPKRNQTILRPSILEQSLLLTGIISNATPLGYQGPNQEPLVEREEENQNAGRTRTPVFQLLEMEPHTALQRQTDEEPKLQVPAAPAAPAAPATGSPGATQVGSPLHWRKEIRLRSLGALKTPERTGSSPRETPASTTTNQRGPSPPPSWILPPLPIRRDFMQCRRSRTNLRAVNSVCSATSESSECTMIRTAPDILPVNSPQELCFWGPANCYHFYKPTFNMYRRQPDLNDS